MTASDIQIRQNVELTVRERGKIVARRAGHNIFLNLGREWLPGLVSYSVLPSGAPPPPTPVTPAEDRRVRYVGLGIGSTRQNNLGIANGAPFVTDYPGTNLRTDTDPTVVRLERPVRFSSPDSANPTEPPYHADDVWLGQVQAPAIYPVPTSVKFQRVVLEDEISYGPYLIVPLSEVGLFLHSVSPDYVHLHDNTCVAYDSFDTLSKTNAFAVEIAWTLRF